MEHKGKDRFHSQQIHSLNLTPWKLTYPLKNAGWKMKFLLKWVPFRSFFLGGFGLHSLKTNISLVDSMDASLRLLRSNRTHSLQVMERASNSELIRLVISWMAGFFGLVALLKSEDFHSKRDLYKVEPKTHSPRCSMGHGIFTYKKTPKRPYPVL